MGLTEYIVAVCTHVIETGGYTAVAFLMVLESMIFPVPSEAVLPFAGLLVVRGVFDFWSVVFFATLGSIIGSVLSYYIGMYGGRTAIMHWGRYLLLNDEHLAATERFFVKYGDKAIFVSRFIPVVRHLISLPAGMGKMNLGIFTIYTILGAGTWNAILLYIGILLGEQWDILSGYMHYIDIVVVACILGGVVYFFLHRKKNVRSAYKNTQPL